MDYRTFLQHRINGVVLDSNLLLLLSIGSLDRNLLRSFKRTLPYSGADYDRLASFLSAPLRLVTTPHLLTETANLANALPEATRLAWYRNFARLARELFEVYEPAQNLMLSHIFPVFGLADAALAHAGQSLLILTDDGRLSAYLRASGQAVVNLRDALRDRA